MDYSVIEYIKQPITAMVIKSGSLLYKYDKYYKICIVPLEEL